MASLGNDMNIYIYTYIHTYIHIYIYICTHTYMVCISMLVANETVPGSRGLAWRAYLQLRCRHLPMLHGAAKLKLIMQVMR